MYNNFISINQKFKSSVNLQFDLFNEDKIEQYVPTSDLCDVIKKYISSVLNNKDKATILTGPYGKGKSYLILIIIYLLSKRSNRTLFKKFINKIKAIDSYLYDLIIEIDNKKISLLPVIVANNDLEDINQNFMLALQNSFDYFNLNEVIPNTTFKECLSLIKKWENYDKNEFDLNLCTKKYKINLDELKIGLKNYSKKALDDFKTLFFCISKGYSFNPLINNDFATIYADVNTQIKKYGYSGMFVVYDEFGTILETKDSSLPNKLNKIQTFAEKCQSSPNDCQLHFCCIAHKDLVLYSNNEKALHADFEKISGRFKQYRFDRSLDENYQILCSSFNKNNDYRKLVNDFYLNNGLFIEKLLDSSIFSSKNQLDYIINNGLPFNPVSLYSLIQVSEKIAQNERTLFTFISDSDNYSFNYFISNYESGLLNVPFIYDYFENSIHNNSDYSYLFYNVEYFKRVLLDEQDRNIIKTIAVIKLINDEIKFPATIENIYLSNSENYFACLKRIKELLDKNILRKNINDGSLDFSIIASESLNSMIEKVENTKFSKSTLPELLNKFDKNMFFVSHKYNFEYCMTRYCASVYIFASKFIKMSDVSFYFKEYKCDGLILNIINDNNIDSETVRKHLMAINTPNLIVRLFNSSFSSDAEKKIKRFFAMKSLIDNQKLSDEITNSLPSLVIDIEKEVSHYIDNIVKDSVVMNNVSKNNNISDVIYDSFKNKYPNTFIINNEQINKHEVSSVSIKSRNYVVDKILSNENVEGRTSAEATIFYSFNVAYENNPIIVENIKNQLLKSDGKKVKFASLIKQLEDDTFGIREGVIPLLIAKAISLINYVSKGKNAILIYNETKEIELSSLSLSRIVDNPEKFSFCINFLNNEKLAVLNSLSKILKIKTVDNVAILLKQNIYELKKYITNLCQTIVKTNEEDNVLSLSTEAINFKDLFMQHDINNYECVFVDIPKLFNCSIDKIPFHISKIFKEYSDAIEVFYKKTTNRIIDLFGFSCSTIKDSYLLWSKERKYISDIIFENDYKKIYKCLEGIQFNDNNSINLLCYSCVRSTILDWNSSKDNVFFDKINFFIKYVNEYKESDKNNLKTDYVSNEDYVLSSLGKTLYSNIIDSLEEYGSSITNKEKAKILSKIMNDLLN